MKFSAAKSLFFVSLMVFSLMYGVGVGKWEWFPYSVLNQAADQARVVYRSWTSPDVTLDGKIYERSGVRSPGSDGRRSRMTLVSTSWQADGEWKTGFKLIGRSGNILHDWIVDRNEVFSENQSKGNPRRAAIHGSHLLPNGDIVLNIQYVGTIRIDACGDVRWALGEGGHHSVERAADGSFWVTGVSKEQRNGSDLYPEGYPGISKSVWLDRILHIADDGTLIERINILDLLYKNGLQRRIFQIDSGDHPDITHMNDVEPLSPEMADDYPFFNAGDLLVSLRDLHLVFVVDPKTKIIKWNTPLELVQQHDPDFMGDGWVGVFDNNSDGSRRGSILGGSRIVAFHPESDSMKVLFPTQDSEPFYTRVRGKWQLLEGGNMLLTESNAGRVVEVDPDGRTVWEYVRESWGSKVPVIFGATRHDLTRDQVASWSCSSVDSTHASTAKRLKP